MRFAAPLERGRLGLEDCFGQRLTPEEKIERGKVSWVYFSENLAILPHI
jgi:hypothetical protein